MSEWMTLIPALVAITVVLWRKEVIIALLMSLFAAEFLLLLKQGQGFWLASGLGPLNTLEAITTVLTDPGNARLLLFALMVGALMAFMRYSGGVTALVEKLVKRGVASNARQSKLLAFGTGLVIFIESNLSVLTAGILSRGLFDKFKISRAELAYIIDSTSAPICILILLNGWGAYILGLLGAYQLQQNPVSILVQTIPLNFYALFTLAIVVYTIYSGKHLAPMRRANLELNKIDGHDEVVTPATKSRYMLLPLLTMIISMVGFMYWTGNGDLAQGSGSKSVLYATTLSCVVAYLLLLLGKQYNHQQLVNIGFKGMSELLGLVSILLLALALGQSLRSLGTGIYISGLVAEALPLWLVPAMLFIAGALISFTTGTSWGTFAILIPIGMPLVVNLGLPPPLILAAIMGGGVFGDHCSPISDTTAVSAVAAGCDLLEHTKTQLPYALISAALAIVGYLICGLWWI